MERRKVVGVLAKDALDKVAESIAFVPDLPDIAATLTEGGCVRYCKYCRLRTAGPGPMAEGRSSAGHAWR